MTNRRTRTKLANMGFEYDEEVTGKDPCRQWWTGTIDLKGRMRVAGDNSCMGYSVSGATRSAMDAEAIRYAKMLLPEVIECPDSDCEFHARKFPEYKPSN